MHTWQARLMALLSSIPLILAKCLALYCQPHRKLNWSFGMSSIGRNQTDCTNASCSILCALISPFNREGGNENEIMRLKNYDKRGKENRTCGLLLMATYAMEISLLWKLVQITIKKSSKLTKKITHADDMMIHNLLTYLFQTRLRLWDIKITNFKPENCQMIC